MPTPVSGTNPIVTPTTSNPDLAPTTPGYSSANTALVASAVEDTLAAQDNGRSPLQKHVDFFDRNNDGKITVSETKEGLSALGLGPVTAWAGAIAINAGLGRTTGASWSDPLTINTDNIAKGKHPGDSDIYDAQGNFSAPKFSSLFNQFDTDGDSALSGAELANFHGRMDKEGTSSLVSKAEFGLLMKVAGEDRDGTEVITSETLASFYDGSLFYNIAGEEGPF